MLPNIGCTTNHANLERDFNVQRSPAKSLYEHWYVFKEIVNSEIVNSDWRCGVMYFSEKWISKIHNDKSWGDLKQYLHETAWHQFEYEMNRIHYDIIFSMIQQSRNLKPNPYLTDTAKHLFATAIGSAPGYAPALDDAALPLHVLQNVFIESYGLKKYHPTIMQPLHFNYEKDKYPVYYSLQNPSTHVFSPKSREASSTLFEMRELDHIMKIFVEELSNKNGMCSDTIIDKISTGVKFGYFHNKVDRHRVIRSSSEIVSSDKRFVYTSTKHKYSDAGFSSDAPFLRGCISISASDHFSIIARCII